MGFLTVIFTFFLTWWTCLFIVLPLKIETELSPEIGNDIGAPKQANMRYKMKVNTILSAVVTLCIWGVFTVYGSHIEDYYYSLTRIS